MSTTVAKATRGTLALNRNIKLECKTLVFVNVPNKLKSLAHTDWFLNDKHACELKLKRHNQINHYPNETVLFSNCLDAFYSVTIIYHALLPVHFQWDMLTHVKDKIHGFCWTADHSVICELSNKIRNKLFRYRLIFDEENKTCFTKRMLSL